MRSRPEIEGIPLISRYVSSLFPSYEQRCYISRVEYLPIDAKLTI